MSGEVLHRGEWRHGGTRGYHDCEPPLVSQRLWRVENCEPDEPLGTIWRCDCGQHWQVKKTLMLSGERLPRWHKLSRRRAERKLRRVAT